MRRLRGPNCLYQKQCNNCNFITDHGRAGDLSRSSHVSKCRCEVKVSQSCPTLCDPMDCIARGILQARILKLSSLSFLQGIFPTQGSNPGLHTLQVDSLPAEPQGKPKNVGVGSLSFLQQIFPTQEWNRGLLHCRRILYQLSYEGSQNVERGSEILSPSLFR